MTLSSQLVNMATSPQVYEHVYETVDINSSPEVRANATAKVYPIPASLFSDHLFFVLLQTYIPHCVSSLTNGMICTA